MPDSPLLDLFVIGGGINGTGIARDAAGRGLSCALSEQNDLGQGTSSRSSKMIHGGLRYLEYFEFRLVRKALIEREVLLRNAPHIIWPLRFVLPHAPQDRPAWLLRLGLYIYDHLGGRNVLPSTRALDLHRDQVGAPLQPQYRRGFEYSDCWVDDARLVVLNAMDAAAHGCRIMTRSRVVRAERQDGIWQITVAFASGETAIFRAKALVNAAGPWVSGVAADVAGLPATRRVQLIKGSHIIVRKFWTGDHAYLIQNNDKRVIFAIPFGDDYALIGTTDIPFDAAPDAPEPTEGERTYLLDAANRYFKVQLTATDILDEFAGVRALFDDGQGNPSAVTRDFAFELNQDGPALLNVFGGKVTTYRELSEQAMQHLAPILPHMGPSWTKNAPLPGGDLPGGDPQQFAESLHQAYPWLGPALAHDLTRRYGSQSHIILNGATSLADLGQHFGARFYEAEARYLIQHEWAKSTEDILTRRTKHHLNLTPAQIESFAQWFAATQTA